MSSTNRLNGLLIRTRELFGRGPTLVDRDSDGHDVQVVVDLCEAAWRTVQAHLVEGGQSVDLQRELATLSPSLPGEMVAAWVEKLWLANVADSEDLPTLAETVVYLVETLRGDPVLENEDIDRWALSITLEERAAQG